MKQTHAFSFTALVLALAAAGSAQGPPQGGGSRRGGPGQNQTQGQSGVPAAQQPTTPDEKKASIQGRIVNSMTGEPVRKAEVTLRRARSAASRNTQGSPSSFQRYTASTDQQGEFILNKIEPGSYRLSYTGRGFLQSEYGAKDLGESGTDLTLTESQHMTNVQLKMTRQAVLSGTIYDDDGDPVEGATVRVLEIQYRSGKRTLSSVDSGETDDRGQYRIPDIAPGKYLIVASAQSRSGMDRYMRRGGGGPGGPGGFGMPAQQIAGQQADETGFASVYYPGVADESQAARLHVTAGSDMGGLDIRLFKTRTFRVSGVVIDSSASGSQQGTMVALMPSSGASVSRYRGVVRGPDGSFEITGVPQGSYTLMAVQGGPDRRGSSPVLMPVDVRNGNLEGVTVTIGPGQTFAGIVAVDGTERPALTSTSISLVSPLPIPMGSPSARVQTDGSFKLDGVQPGKYIVNVSGVPAGGYVQSIKAGSQDILFSELDASGGIPGQIEVTVSMKGGQVSGTVQAKDAPVPDATVVLVPEPVRRIQSSFFKTATTDQTGAFTVKGLAPGDYTAYAWEKIDAGAWQNPDVLSLVEGQGEKVKISAGGTETVQLKLIPALRE